MERHDPPRDIIAILGRRALTEARLGALLEEVKCKVTVEDIKAIIFDERIEGGFTGHIGEMLSLLDAKQTTTDLDEILDVAEDAWNYFPHRSLAGRSPAELLVEEMQSRTDQVTDMTNIEPDPKKIDNAVLALLLLGLHEKYRVWKGHDWDALDRLHAKGYISDPASRAKSVVLTEEGLREAERLFQELFSRDK